MAKQIIALCLLATLFVACCADSRNLLQKESGNALNCNRLKELDGKCCSLCKCIGAKNKVFGSNDAQKLCGDMCSKCVGKAGSSDCANGLPSECQSGLNMSGIRDIVSQCINEYSNNSNKMPDAYKC